MLKGKWKLETSWRTLKFWNFSKEYGDMLENCCGGTKNMVILYLIAGFFQTPPQILQFQYVKNCNMIVMLCWLFKCTCEVLVCVFPAIYGQITIFHYTLNSNIDSTASAHGCTYIHISQHLQAHESCAWVHCALNTWYRSLSQPWDRPLVQWNCSFV